MSGECKEQILNIHHQASILWVNLAGSMLLRARKIFAFTLPQSHLYK